MSISVIAMGAKKTYAEIILCEIVMDVVDADFGAAFPVWL